MAVDTVNPAPSDYKNGVHPVWCPGCGDYGILASFYKAVADLHIPREQLALVAGIGCSGRFPSFVNTYAFHATHGRALPVATGVKMAHPELVVATIGGDGDIFSIGMGHFPHAARRNVDITCIVIDNGIYGMTKGQPSPTSPVGLEKKASPYGTIESPIDPLQLAFSCNASFVARAYSDKPQQVTEILESAILHKGFSLVVILSPCVTFNDTRGQFKLNTAPLPSDYDPAHLGQAREFVANEAGTLHLGIFYQQPRLTYDEDMAAIRSRKTPSGYGIEDIAARYLR